MANLDTLGLLKFLSKPRFIYEVAEHYKISTKLANLHLREAIKSGQVLISEKPISQTLKTSNGSPKRFEGFVYIFRKSPVLVDGCVRFIPKKQDNLILNSRGDVFSIRFISDAHGTLGKAKFSHKLSSFTSEETEGSKKIRGRLKTEIPLTSEFGLYSVKTKLVKHRGIEQSLSHKTQLVQGEAKSISHEERIHFFQALLREPLTFLDIHGCYGVSKQTLRRLVKNGLIAELWGPKEIGVRFKLTNKGKTYLKELEAAARYEPRIKETSFIRLKTRSSL